MFPKFFLNVNYLLHLRGWGVKINESDITG